MIKFNEFQLTKIDLMSAVTALKSIEKEIPEVSSFESKTGENQSPEVQRYLECGYNSENTKYRLFPKERLSNLENLLSPWKESCLQAQGICQSPGNFLPWHRDSFSHLLGKGPQYDGKLMISLVFLEDWHPGQVLLFENMSISHWAAGDQLHWPTREWHCSANLGFESKYSIQIVRRQSDLSEIRV